MRKKATNSPSVEEFKALTKALKDILKERGVSYRDLAQGMGMSESGVKKIFSGDDCSFQKLMQISKLLKVKFSDLLHEIEDQEMRPVTFSSEQQQMFLKNKALFNFFVKLVIERMPVEEIKKESKLTEAQVFKYLRELDEQGHIELLPENRVRVPEISLVSNFGHGPLLEKTYQDWSRRAVIDIAHPKHQASGQFIIRCLKMKEDTYLDFLAQLKDLEKQVAKRALREMAVSTRNLITTRWVSMTDKQSFIEGSIQRIDD